jgi:serine/threonine-protein kinase
MSHWRPGEQFARRFVIEGWLASGGMAEIYVAQMSLALGANRRVALKRVHTHLAEDPHFIELFIDEARLASQLVHPGVVPVHDIVEEEGEIVLVLDYVPGWDLSTLLSAARKSSLVAPIGVAYSVARTALETLAYVHEAKNHLGAPLQIVHRDVTPSNILIAEDGSSRLLDFGVAKAAERASHTATRSIKGKLAYLSPEQALASQLDARSDLYAVGLVLYEMLTGKRALKADGDIALLELARRPRHRPASELRAEVPAELDALLTRLLAVDRDERPKNAREAVAAMEAIRPLIQSTGSEEIRAFVATLMSSPSRPLREEGRALDRAFAQVAGIELGAPGTKAVALPPPPPPASIDEAPTMPTPPRREKRRWPAVLVAGLAVSAIGGSLIFWPQSVVTDPKTSMVALERTAFLRVRTEPSGAAVSVDGVTLSEKTPLVIESTPGVVRRLSFVLDGYLSATSTAVAGEGTTDVELALERDLATLIVRSTPPGAEVTVDERAVGVTPLTLRELPRKTALVRLSLPRFASYEAEAPLDTAREHLIDAVLEAKTRFGLLDVSSTPWASVRAGKKVLAESTPALGLRLPVGRHTITLTNPRLKKTVRREVEIVEGKRASLIVDLGH